MSTASRHGDSGSSCIHFRELFGRCTWWRAYGTFQTIVSLVALSLSIGILHPVGPVTLSQLPIPNNWIWLTSFSVLNVFFLVWSVLGIFRRGIREKLERRPTLYRSFVLANMALIVAAWVTVVGYAYVGLNSNNGCFPTKTRPSCPAAITVTVFDGLWSLVESGFWGWSVYRYYCRDRFHEKEDETSGRERWFRGIQSFFAALFVLNAVSLYIPSGLPVVVGLRTGRFAWVLLAGAAVSIVLSAWNFIIIFALKFFHKAYGRFILFTIMEVYAATAPVGLCAAFIYLYLLSGTACASARDQGCFAVYVNVGFAGVFWALQVYQIALFFKKYRRCWPKLRDSHRRKKNLNNQKREEERGRKREEERRRKRENTLDRTMPNAYDNRNYGRGSSRTREADQKRRADVAIPKPVKQKTSHRNVPYDDSRQYQSRNAQEPRDIGTMFSNSGRSQHSDHTSFSQPSTVSRRRMNGMSQRTREDKDRAPRKGQVGNARVLLVDSATLPGSQPGSIQRQTTGASSHRSRRRRHENIAEEVSPLSSPVELDHLAPAPRTPSPLTLRSYEDRTIPGITITPCGSNHSSMIPRANHYDGPAHQSDSEFFVSHSYTKICVDAHEPTYNKYLVPTTPELDDRRNLDPPPYWTGNSMREWSGRAGEKE